MSLSASRLTHWRGRRSLSAMLVLVYAWAFVALGLTHQHGSAHPAPYRPSSSAAVAPATGALIIAPAVASTNDAPCGVCAAAHATSVALVQPSVPTYLPAPAGPLRASFAAPAPSRSIPASNPRGPPQV